MGVVSEERFAIVTAPGHRYTITYEAHERVRAAIKDGESFVEIDREPRPLGNAGGTYEKGTLLVRVAAIVALEETWKERPR